MKVVVLDNLEKEKYDNFLKKNNSTLFFASGSYKNLLAQILNAEPKYLLAVDDNDLIRGALPLMIFRNQQFGTVINSLPFYGSNGGLLGSDDDDVKKALLDQYKELLGKEENVISGTIVTSPFEKNNTFYESHLPVTFKDSRIGQITSFGTSTEDTLMDIFHYKTRNSIRKGIKEGITVSWENGLEYMSFLYETHKENMSKINISGKPQSFFELLPSYFKYGTEYRVYIAFYRNEPIAALLTFYFNKTVEYFTPVTIEHFREKQPMSVIIYEAMKDALGNNFSFWNWGGTGLNQTGVYDFKKKWGTSDFPYYYYTTLLKKDLSSYTKETLLQQFPYFYVVPFNAL